MFASSIVYKICYLRTINVYKQKKDNRRKVTLKPVHRNPKLFLFAFEFPFWTFYSVSGQKKDELLTWEKFLIVHCEIKRDMTLYAEEHSLIQDVTFIFYREENGGN